MPMHPARRAIRSRYSQVPGKRIRGLSRGVSAPIALVNTRMWA